MRLHSASVSCLMCFLLWIHLLLCPCGCGTKTAGPPSHGTKTAGPPSRGTKTAGPPSHGSKTDGPPTPAVGGAQGRLERWVQTGFQYLKRTVCREEGASCRRLAHLHMSGVAVYVSYPVDSDKVVAILPDSYPPPIGRMGGGSTGHDAVLVLDPSPGHSFGHPLAVFYVDRNLTKKRCAHMEGIYLGEECVTLAVKGRCQNQMKRCSLGAGTERGGAGRLVTMAMGGGATERGGAGRLVTMAMRGGATRGLCEVHFLPLVVGVADLNRTQRLRCFDHPEFSGCPRPLPSLAPPPPSLHQGCELRKNTRRCHVTQPVATPLSCRLYQTCDHAVLLAGGWQQHMTFQSHVVKLQSFYSMLRSNGLRAENIHVFLAGNNPHIPEVGAWYPALDKAVVRNHIWYVCHKQHCADSLVLYLNCPTRCDGTMLLWDHNLDGIADLKERYSVSELLADLAACRASRVLLFVDQSYSSVLERRLRASHKHPNVVLIHQGDRPGARGNRPIAQQNHPPMEQTWQGYQQNQRQDPVWEEEEGSWDSIRPHSCLLEHLGRSPGMSRLLEPWAGLLNVTLAGAPCKAMPPLTDGEMKRQYQGCQNLPTALWYRNPYRQSPSPQRKLY